ncbi:MAG: TetR/AcrR family transcriptional regulator [Leptospiraceae bacterium]|nr:TetR/AcrR family transcriptional regulator [Leptospiraceae bacterium]MCB1315440.1 TetR/AcrR family transcriptional regulator [Leptospiraceae bacterium]
MGILERKEREKAERRRSILDAARELIREKTYEEITMEELARRLELSRATLYLYFRNKSEIYTTLLAEGMQELEKGYRQVLSRGIEDPLEKLMGMAYVFFEFYSRSHSYFDLIVTKRAELLKDISEETLSEFETAGASVIGPLIDVCREGAEKGSWREQPPDKMAWLLRAIAIGIAVGFREGNLKFPADVELMKQFLLFGLKGQPDA